MSLIEVCILVIAAAAVISCAACVVFAWRVLALVDRADRALPRIRESLERLDRAAKDLEGTVARARRLRERVDAASGWVTRRAKPRLGRISAVASGVRAGFGALMGPRRDPDPRGDGGRR